MAKLYDYISGITEDPNNKIMLYFPKTNKVFSGFIDSEQTFGATSSYEALSESPMIDKASELVQTGSELFGEAYTLKYPWMTKKSWTGSTTNDLSFSIYKLAVNEEDDLISLTEPIWESVLPSVDEKNKGGILGSYIPPNSYNAGGSLDGRNGEKPVNTIVIKFGNWYEADGWIMTSALMTVSKEKIDEKKTKPLYIRIDISLTRSMNSTSSEFKGWFK